MKINKLDEMKKEHQVAVFIDISVTATEGGSCYIERANRMANSFNHEKTMKADIFVFNMDGKDYGIVGKYYGLPTEWTEENDAPFPQTQLNEWAKSKEYGAVMFMTATGRTIE